MNFNKTRMSKLAGLLTEGSQCESENCEGCTEENPCEECAQSEGYGDESYESVIEPEVLEIADGYDLQAIIRKEIARALNSRDESSKRYSSGQIFGKTAPNNGTVTMGFPGIGFKR